MFGNSSTMIQSEGGDQNCCGATHHATLLLTHFPSFSCLLFPRSFASLLSAFSTISNYNVTHVCSEKQTCCSLVYSCFTYNQWKHLKMEKTNMLLGNRHEPKVKQNSSQMNGMALHRLQILTHTQLTLLYLCDAMCSDFLFSNMLTSTFLLPTSFFLTSLLP